MEVLLIKCLEYKLNKTFNMSFKFFDIDRPFGPRRLMYNVPYGDGY